MPENVNTSVLEIQNDAESIEDDRPTMIKVDHVSMVFNMASEQLNSLKEYAIKLAKRELFFEGFKALDDVSFEVKKGDVFGIMGTNGSGKSTMLKIIAGVLEPSSGTCEINGNIAPLIELGAGFDMELTARENIYLNGALLGYSKEFINDHFDEIVDFAEIESFLDMPLKNYSSGMVARIAFAIATVIVPEILVVDEVLSVGDFMFQKKCEDRINELIEKHGVTVLIVSHSNEQIARLCNKAIWVEKGHTRLLGDASLVTRVYGVLGGRTGSPEAEARIFNELAAMHKPSDLGVSVACDNIVGNGPLDVNACMAFRAGENTYSDSIVLVPDNTHINAIVANSLASAVQAPVLAMDLDEVPDAIECYIFKHRPSRILVVDIGRKAFVAVEALKDLPWEAEVVWIGEQLSTLDFSKEVFDYASSFGVSAAKIALVDFDCNLEALSLSGMFYLEKLPVFMFRDFMAEEECIASLLLHLETKNILLITAEVPDWFIGFCEENAIELSTISGKLLPRRCLDAVRLVGDSRKTVSEMIVAGCHTSQWINFLSAGFYCAKKNAAMLFFDDGDLDLLADAMDCVTESAPSRLLFLEGDALLSSEGKELFIFAAGNRGIS